MHLPSGERTTIYDASVRYRNDGVPTIILAGAEYGTGSSRDWAGKGPALLGVRAVVAKSFERIHRSNLIGMGILPLEFPTGESWQSLGLTGHETYDVAGIPELFVDGYGGGGTLTVTARADDGKETSFEARVRVDTAEEANYYRNGGILHYVLRKLMRS